MKKNIAYICLHIILSSVLFFNFCKKKETSPETPVTAAPSQDAYYGMIYSCKIFIYQTGTLTPAMNGGLSGGLFSTSPLIQDGVSNFAYADTGTVSLNTTVFKKSGGSFIYYTGTTYSDYNASFNWMVSGGSGIPAINYTYSVSLPSYTGYSALNNTITIGQLNTLNLTGITGADEIEVHISSGSTCRKMKLVSGNTTSVSFSSQDLSSLTATESGFIYVTCYKVNYQTIGSKKIKFKVGYEIIKADVVLQ